MFVTFPHWTIWEQVNVFPLEDYFIKSTKRLWYGIASSLFIIKKLENPLSLSILVISLIIIPGADLAILS